MRYHQTTEKAALTINRALLGLLAVFIIALAFQKQRWDADIFWALKSGEWILSNFQVPRTDPFSFTFEGREWVDFTWGFQVLSFVFFKYFGQWKGLFALQAAIFLSVYFFMYANLRLHSVKSHIAVFLLFIVFYSSFSRYFIRPHLFEYFFISLYFLLLALYEKKNCRLALYALIPLQALWVNIHSSFILGIFITGAYAAGSVLDLFREKGFRADLPKSSVELIIVSLLLPLASLVNPYGLKLVVFPFIHQSPDNADALRHIAEWAKVPVEKLFFFISPLPLNNISFKIMFYGSIILMAINWRKLRSRDAFLIAGALYMAYSHVRFVAQFAYFALPVIAANLYAIDGKFLERVRHKVFLTLLTVVSAGYFISQYAALPGMFNFGLGIADDAFPQGTVSFMKKEGIRGRMFNEYVYGGFLIHQMPENKVFIDGRTPTVYSPYFFWTSRLSSEPDKWDKLVGEHGLNMVLIKQNDKLCKQLWENRQWAAVSFDNTAVLFLKRGDGFDDVIGKWEFKAISPCFSARKDKLPEKREDLALARDEIKRAMARGGMESTARHSFLLGVIDTELGGEHIEEAAHELRQAAKTLTDPLVHYEYGRALGKLKMHSEAIDAFKMSIKLDKNYRDGYLGLGFAYYDSKDHGKAIKAFKKFLELAQDGADPLAYEYLGYSCYESGDLDCASAYLRRAAFAAGSDASLGNIYYKLGSALFEKREYEEGSKYYEKALSIDNSYEKVLKKLADDFRLIGREEQSKELLKVLLPVRD